MEESKKAVVVVNNTELNSKIDEGFTQYRELVESNKLEIEITNNYKQSILFEIPTNSKTLNTFLHDPTSGLFPPATLKEVFKIAKNDMPFITGGQIITTLVLQKLSKGLIVEIDQIKHIGEIAGLHSKTVSNNLKVLQKPLLFAQEREGGGIAFKGKILLTKQLNTSHIYKLNGEFFTTEKFVTTGKGKNQKTNKEIISFTLLNLKDLKIFLSELPNRSHDRAIVFFIYLNHMFTRQNCNRTQNILMTQIKGKIFFKDVFYRNDISNTIKLYLDAMVKIGYIFEYKFSNNRFNKESVCITWKEITKQKNSFTRESKNANRESKNA